MTDVAPPDVVLLRSADSPDPYVQAFADVEMRAVCQPVLDFQFPADDALRERLRRSGAYGGIIATSPRAARALRRVFDASGTLHAEWEGRPAYVVGPKTAARFRDLSFDVRGEHTGNAENLVAWLTDTELSSPLLFLSGNRRRDTLPDGLRAAGISFEEEVVYETHFRTDLRLPPPDGKTWLAFFSPSGLKALRQSGVEERGGYRIAAIGPTTAATLREKGMTVDAVAEAPAPDSLVTAVINSSPPTGT